MLLLNLLNFTNCTVLDCNWFFNETLEEQEDDIDLYPFSLVVPFTFIYVVIFLMGVVGNVSTCIVIAKNKSMQNATNSYLFSLACSDLLLLLSGLPPEMYRIWSPDKYIFGEAFCIMQGFFAETSANATVLTITLFTVERYLAICHPFVAQTMSKLSRAIKSIICIWIIAMALAVPQAIQFGIFEEFKNGETYTHCTLVKAFTGHAFEISTFVIFVGPMLLITILYVLIGIQLRKAKKITAHRGSSNNNPLGRSGGEFKSSPAQRRVVHMLIAVVVAFFICWAPFHTQRLLAVYLSSAPNEERERLFQFYLYLMYISGVLYFVSTTVNPVLYHIMSKKFRKAFKDTFRECCCHNSSSDYAAINRVPPSQRSMQRSISEVGQVNVNVGKQRQRIIPMHIKKSGRSDSKISDTSRSSFLSDSSRSTVICDKSKPANDATTSNNNNVRRSSDNNDNSRILPLKFYKFFGRSRDPRGGGSFEPVKDRDISNSSLKDTDTTELNQCDLVNDMINMNQKMT